MIQTTIGMFNRSLYDLSTTKALLAWQRVRLANWLAGGGEEWANIVSQYNSGIYCMHILLTLGAYTLDTVLNADHMNKCFSVVCNFTSIKQLIHSF